MIEEQGRIIAAKGNDVWIETIRQSTCGACSARAGCGQSLLAKVASGKRNHIRISTDIDVAVNDQVLLGIPEHALIKSSVLAYGLPLISFILFVVVADKLLEFGELGTILFGFSGLGAGFLLTWVYGVFAKGYADCQPVILKKLPKKSDYLSLTSIA